MAQPQRTMSANMSEDLQSASQGAAPGRLTLVTDLDNTLWDWFAGWYGSFSAMLEELVLESGIPQDVLEAEIQAVHRQYHTTEYSNLLNEVPSLRQVSTTQEPWQSFPKALEALRSERRRLTKLYPGVVDTLQELRRAGYLIIAYTESVAYWTEWRIRHLGLDGVLDILFSAPDHDLPAGVSVNDLRSRPETYYGLEKTKHRHVASGVLKPNVGVLRDILDGANAQIDGTFYVGDSLMKDVAMAQGAGVVDIHAKYGEVQSKPEYQLLRRVSHWTDDDIEREKQISERRRVVIPTHVCHERFEELLRFVPLP